MRSSPVPWLPLPRRPMSRTSGAAPGARWITTSVNATPAPSPCRAPSSTASLAANRPARRSIRSGTVADLIKLSLHEAARNQWIARILDPTPHLGDLYEIDPVPDYIHVSQQPPDRLSVGPGPTNLCKTGCSMQERGKRLAFWLVVLPECCLWPDRLSSVGLGRRAAPYQPVPQLRSRTL